MLLALVAGCKTYTVAPGSEPLVVHAEYTAEVALELFDSFLAWERKHEVAMISVDPGIHQFAESLRTHGKRWIEELNTATRTYKQQRTGTNRDALVLAQAFLDLAMRETQIWLIRGKGEQ